MDVKEIIEKYRADGGQSAVFYRDKDGQVVLDDPVALGVIKGIAKAACRDSFEAQKERVAHFVQRLKARGIIESHIIVLINADDPLGKPLAESLMPGFDWQPIRDQGEVPYARGMVSKEHMLEMLETLGKEDADELRAIKGIAVLVIDHGVPACFAAE